MSVETPQVPKIAIMAIIHNAGLNANKIQNLIFTKVLGFRCKTCVKNFKEKNCFNS